ncbi:nuclease-related domain-containing protein [Natribacillus halophilus]|uniref:Nuclease-related domain-containing protein n=1 Tax=Natribacillus halophilus TaxID=549003 RepID=A0A1G8NK66_9BACI|nr:nuclease-related domain-containing protein [Natribacillus halophilus]SDI80624.1 Nuclease-related domain-containing protein [Natribacillus halophilus]
MKTVKEREPSLELKVLRLLNPRMNLPDDQYYMNLEKGYAGELKLDVWLEGLRNDCLVVNDLLLKHKGKIFQIDSLVIFQRMIHLFDSKYHKGDFYLDDNKWKTIVADEITSPLPQLERCESLLSQLLRQRLNMNLPIEAYLVFTHPEFTLYHASPELPAIFPTQFNSFMKKMNNLGSKLDRSHEKLAEQLVALHLHESPNTQWPEYDFGQLKKGVVCSECSSFMIEKGRIWICAACGQKENSQSAILRSIREFKILFPRERITTPTIIEWCKVEGDRKKVYRTLTKHFKKVGSKSASYYID